MIAQDVFAVEPWAVPERVLDLGRLPQTESLFALSNGHIGLRGNLDEGEPSGAPGTFLNGFYETRPLPYAEVAYGYPEAGQTMINVTNGKVIRLLVDDEPFDVAGTWLVAVAGFGGMRDHGDTLSFAPRLPSRLSRLAFRLVYRGRRLRVDVSGDAVSYEVLEGEPLELVHHGEHLTVHRGAPERRGLPSPVQRDAAQPPSGRLPPRRHQEA